MRSPRSASIALLAVTALAAACSGGTGSGPGWTYAPAASVTPAPSTAASGEPTPGASESQTPSAAPSGPAASGSPAASGAAGDALEVTAVNIEFEEKELTTAANQPFGIQFVNEDPPGTIHDIDIRDSGGQTLQDQDTIDGGEETTYDYTPLAAGTYTFICSIHPIPNMTGTLTVE